MADLKALSGEMEKLKRQLETVLYISGYRDYDDLSGLDDYKQIKTADERQKLEEYRNILYKLDEVQGNLAYFDKPVKEVSTLHMNASGRYETVKGHCYTSGSGIEFLRTEEVYNYDTDKWENAGIWTCSRVESQNGEYYIVGYSDVKLSGLKVRVRGGKRQGEQYKVVVSPFSHYLKEWRLCYMAEKRKDNKGRNLRTGESQRKDGRYMYRWTVEGKEKTVYALSLEELREKERQIQRDIEDGVDSKKADTTTLNDMFKKYMAGKTELKQSTRTNYNYMYKNYVRDSLGKKKLSKIKYSDVKAFYTALIREKNFKPNSMEIINTILHPVFTLAVRDGYIRTNPSDGAMQEIKKSHNWEKPKRHALTIEEQEAFIGYMAQSPIYNHWLPIFTVLLGTGCRIGELIGLRWCDCDFENNIISINHNLIYRRQDNGKCEMHITTPKTKAGTRTIPMLSEVRKALFTERKNQMQKGFSDCEIDGYSNFVFLNREGYVHNPMTLNRAIGRIIRDYNAEESENAKKEKREPVLIRHFSVHNLRHTFCTRFCENEQNLKVIQEIMGHSDISTTMNVYAEATEGKKQEAFKNLEGKIKIG